jgi:hypothetical protein
MVDVAGGSTPLVSVFVGFTGGHCLRTGGPVGVAAATAAFAASCAWRNGLFVTDALLPAAGLVAAVGELAATAAGFAWTAAGAAAAAGVAAAGVAAAGVAAAGTVAAAGEATAAGATAAFGVGAGNGSFGRISMKLTGKIPFASRPTTRPRNHPEDCFITSTNSPAVRSTWN